MLTFSGERIVPEADNCEPLFALKMYQEHIARYLFASQVVQGKSVLDVGCGVGYGSQLLARKGASKVVSFDVSDEAIAHAKEFYPHSDVHYSVAAAEEFSFDEKFDLITCFELIEHLSRQHETISRISAALTSDGVLVISTPRPKEKQRSAFHARELGFLDFSNLLGCYFAHIEWFFENDHFASLVTGSDPEAIHAVHRLHPQFGVGQADYFVAVASHSPIDRERFQSQLVLNNDAYVKNLERDVEILHAAENSLKETINTLTFQLHTLRDENESLRSELESARNSGRQLEDAKAEVAEITRLNEEREVELRAIERKAAANERRGQSEIDGLKSELLRLSQELADARLQKADQIKRSQARNQFAERLKAELVQVRAAFEQMQAHAVELQNERDELNRWKNFSAELQQQLDRWRQSAIHAKTATGLLEEKINTICASRSWRVTKPLRRVASGFRRNGVSKIERFEVFDNALLSNTAAQTTTLEAIPSESLHLTTPEKSIDIAHFGRTSNVLLDRREFDVVYVIGCHEGESKRYRVHNLVKGLTRLGYVTESISDRQIPDLIERRYSARVIVLFRCAYDESIKQLLQYCREDGIVTIFDIDDLVFEPESIENVHVVRAFAPEDRASYLRDVGRYRQTLLECDRVTCTTSYLAERISTLGKPVDVIPNSLNETQLAVARGIRIETERQNTELRIGYFSGSNTHQVDFEACEAALLHILRTYPQSRFVLVGILGLGPEWDEVADRVERYPIMSYGNMLQILAGTDINLAPLEKGNPYCEGKSQLKIFEAGLVSIPTVASSTQSFCEAIDDGVDGFLASTTGEWIQALERLINSEELRVSVGARAKRRALKQFGPKTVALQAAEVYGFSVRTVVADGESSDERLHITWIVPGLIIGGGGHRNILRAAYYLEQFGHKIELYFTSTEMDSYELRETVRTHFYPLQCPMYRYDGHIDSTDVLIATHWSTVDAAIKARESARELIYFVQDFEPAFAPMGTEYILAENTYRLGIYNITSGPWCAELLKKQFGCEADHFLFPIDRSIYRRRMRKKDNLNVIFFAKPEMPRRCFELGIMALEKFHQLRPDVEIVMFGSSHLRDVTFPFPVSTLAVVPSLEDLAQCYSNGTLGIVFSTTNPSLVPYEMMACGLPVVDLGRPGNEINYDSRTDIAFLADSAPATMANQIRDLIEDRQQLAMRSRNGLEFVKKFPSEEEMARRVEELILARMTSRQADRVAAHA